MPNPTATAVTFTTSNQFTLDNWQPRAKRGLLALLAALASHYTNLDTLGWGYILTPSVILGLGFVVATAALTTQQKQNPAKEP